MNLVGTTLKLMLVVQYTHAINMAKWEIIAREFLGGGGSVFMTNCYDKCTQLHYLPTMQMIIMDVLLFKIDHFGKDRCVRVKLGLMEKLFSLLAQILELARKQRGISYQEVYTKFIFNALFNF